MWAHHGEERHVAVIRVAGVVEDPPTATVQAGYSKRRREDTQILHPEVARQLKEWLAPKEDLGPDDPLFLISGRVPGGKERPAHLMIKRDLKVARDKWIEDGETEAEKEIRLKTDFLCYCDHAGLYADFHSFRHMYITSLEHAGISPKMAQTLARHSDIRLTLGVYTHITLHDQTAAVGALPGPPKEEETAAPRADYRLHLHRDDDIANEESAA